MKLLERKRYLDELKGVRGTPDIKVICGVRRCGKSCLMELFEAFVSETNPEANIISANLELLSFERLREYHALNSYVEERYVPGRENLLFIDEVQMCAGFELAVNSLHASGRYDIYITGSNAFLLSSDLATLFTGRAYRVEVYPFSFEEYLEFYKERFEGESASDAFDAYIREGGMPGSYSYFEPEDRYRYIASVFDTIAERDIRQKYAVKNTGALERVSDYLMDNISNPASQRKISDALERDGQGADHKTVGNYIGYLCDAYLFYRVRRYDLKGKAYLSTNEKYYLSDHAFRYAKIGTRNMDFGRTMENIVAIELLRRGYEVYAGVLYQKEIDFVAARRDEKVYIQVCDDVSDPGVLKRETDPLLAVRDAYPKMLIARTRHEAYDFEGIKIVDIGSWLLRKEG